MNAFLLIVRLRGAKGINVLFYTLFKMNVLYEDLFSFKKYFLQVDRQLFLMGTSSNKLGAKNRILESFIPICIIYTGLLYYLSVARNSSLFAHLQGAAIFLEILMLSSVAQLGYISCLDLQQRFFRINKAICKLQEVKNINFESSHSTV